MPLRALLLLALAAPLAACVGTAEDDPIANVPAGEVAVPADSGAGGPRLSRDADGRPLLSWTEPDGDGDALRYTVWTGTGWSEPYTADAGPGRFGNWADTPGVLPLGDGRLLAHVLTMHPDGDSPYAYDVGVRQSGGDGRWSETIRPHTDGVPAEHGFVSAVPLKDGRAGLVWLDGRNTGGGHGAGAMTLRYAALGPNGALSDEAVLDSRTCDCCPTAMTAVPGGLVVAYRDRSPAEVRDISVVRLVEGTWTEPQAVHADNWEIAGCPVNGPALAAEGDRVALAWYTEAGGDPRVQLATSNDGGATWGPPTRIDGGTPLGRVGVAIRPDGSAIVSWLESTGDRAEVRVRSIGSTGALGEPTAVATTVASRASGIPRVLSVGDGVLVAWTDPEATVPLRTALVAL